MFPDGEALARARKQGGRLERRWGEQLESTPMRSVEEREEYSVILKGKPGTRPGSCRAADT